MPRHTRPRRVPSRQDFAPLSPELTLALHFPSPPEATTAILILFHGLGDSESSFASFAKSMDLPGVLAIAVRGSHPLPPALLGDELDGGPPRHFHWGDDLTLATHAAGLDTDPGFSKAFDLVMQSLVTETLLEQCGWLLSDILLFGFGQGASLALGLASKVRERPRVDEVTDDTGGRPVGRPVDAPSMFNGVVSIGGALPASMIPTLRATRKSMTPVLVCHGTWCEAVDEGAMHVLQSEFLHVREVKWSKANSGMPSNREEMLPIMQFLAERLRTRS